MLILHASILDGKKTMHNLNTLDRARVRIDHRVDSKEPSCVE